jgi:hypothetical protein
MCHILLISRQCTWHFMNWINSTVHMASMKIGICLGNLPFILEETINMYWLNTPLFYVFTATCFGSILRAFNFYPFPNLCYHTFHFTHILHPVHLYHIHFTVHHTVGGAVGWGTALQTGRARDQFAMVSLEFFIHIIFPASLWLWG